MPLTRRAVLGGAVLAGCAPAPPPPGAVHLPDTWPGAAWETVQPAQAGWDDAGLAAAKSYTETIGTSTFLVAQHGRVVVAWGGVASYAAA